MRVDDILNEKTKQRLDPKCWDGYKKQGTKMKGGVRVNNCVNEDVPVEENGLQRYTGIKKYGKKGFEALQKAGREGASEEQKGAIKDKDLKKDTQLLVMMLLLVQEHKSLVQLQSVSVQELQLMLSS